MRDRNSDLARLARSATEVELLHAQDLALGNDGHAVMAVFLDAGVAQFVAVVQAVGIDGFGLPGGSAAQALAHGDPLAGLGCRRRHVALSRQPQHVLLLVHQEHRGPGLEAEPGDGKDHVQSLVEDVHDGGWRDRQGENAAQGLLRFLAHAQFSFRLDALGDVGPGRQVAIGPPRLVEEGNDGGIHPIEGAVLLAVAQDAVPHLAAGNGFPHAPEELRRVVTGIEDAVALPHQFVTGVLADVAKLVVDVDDDAPGIGSADDGMLVEGELLPLQLDGRPQQAVVVFFQHPFVGFALGDIPGDDIGPGYLNAGADGNGLVLQVAGVALAVDAVHLPR